MGIKQFAFYTALSAIAIMVTVGLLSGASSSYANTTIDTNTISARIGIFNSQKSAQAFFESLPSPFHKTIDPKQLWLNAYPSESGLTEYYLDISALYTDQANQLCAYIKKQDTQCVISERKLLIADTTKNEKTVTPIDPPASAHNYPIAISKQSPPRMLAPLGLRLDSDISAPEMNPFDVRPNPPSFTTVAKGKTTRTALKEYSDAFTLEQQVPDTPKARAAKAAYETARNNFLSAVQKAGTGINSGEGQKATQDSLLSLGRNAFEAAGSAYLSGYLEENLKTADVLSSDAGSGKAFVHHVKKNLGDSAKTTVEALVSDILSSAISETGLQSDIISKKTDEFMLSGARGLINAGLKGAQRSDLYALRNLELEYNLNNFEDSYFSVLTTQPIYQSGDLRHNVFLQGGGIINEQSVDIDDDASRHTLNVGAAYRYLTIDEKYLVGGNIFFDHQWPYNHSRISLGIDAKAKDLNFAANYYHPLSDFKNSRTDANGLEYEERALEGYDIEVGYNPPLMPRLNVFGKGYQYFRDTDEDIRGLELSAEYQVRDNFILKGALVEENGGRDGVEVALQYRMPLYDTEKPNMALNDLEAASGNASVRNQIFEKVRRENRIRVEERLKVDQNAGLVSAQFSALSGGLPFDVGGALTGAGVNLPTNTPITVPNGDFGIINFSNGAIANLSASGGGDVIVEFNASTLTITATNGGFVQFISASGGISIVNIPGGTVNLLGTDIDVTDDGTTTTIQVRAGQIEVVPDVGVAILNGNQADVVSLTIATGVTSLLINPALETRQEAAFTNLDFVNPDPPNTSTSAPFVNLLPVLTTGPQFIGNNADLRLAFTQAVSIVGAPFINGLVGINARTFAYDAGASTPTQLIFRHVYVAGDVGAASITINDLDLNGGTIISTANTLNAIAAFTDTIVPITDLTAPSLTGSTPVDGEPAFSAGADIILNFDENIQAGIGNIVLTDTTDGSDTRIIPIGDAQVTIAGTMVTINPTGILDLTTDYDFTIAAGVIEDTSSNAFAGITTGNLNFTTSNDVTPPMLTGTTPNDDDANIAVNTNFVLTFDENVQAVAGNIVITDTTDGSDIRNIPIGDVQISIVGNTITINPSTNLEIGTAYDVTIASGVIEDLIGNDFGGITAGNFNFTTIPITSLAQVTGLPTGNYIVTANAQTFTGYVETSLGSSWLLVGRGRQGWQFDSNGQGTNADVSSNLGVVAGFTPAAYEDAIINGLITNAAIDLTDVEIRINRAADIVGTNYQEVLWRPTVQAAWVWTFDTTNYQVIHDVQASVLGGASSSTRNTRDANPGNDHRRIFTWGWGSHASQKGFAYGSAISGVNGNDPNTFLWENGSENHAIPYAEIYIRVE